MLTVGGLTVGYLTICTNANEERTAGQKHCYTYQKVFVKNFGDKGMLLNIEKHGGDSGNSVYMNAKLWEGEWVSLYMGLMKKYAEQTNRLSGVADATQFTRRTSW